MNKRKIPIGIVKTTTTNDISINLRIENLLIDSKPYPFIDFDARYKVFTVEQLKSFISELKAMHRAQKQWERKINKKYKNK